MVGLGLPFLGYLLWSKDAQIPNTENVNISLNDGGVVAPFRLSAVDTDMPEHLLPPVTSFSAMIERPLFSPDRRDQLLVVPGRSPVAEEVDQLESSSFPIVKLIGTFADGNDFRALINDQHGVRSVAIGQEIEDWHVTMIDSRRLKLERGAEKRMLTIFESES